MIKIYNTHNLLKLSGMQPLTQFSKIPQTDKPPALSSSPEKLGRTAIDFFSVPKHDFAKTRLSVNMFQLKVKQPLLNHNIAIQPAKKALFYSVTKNSYSSSATKNNFLHDIGEQEQKKLQGRDQFPSLDRYQELTPVKTFETFQSQNRKLLSFATNKKIKQISEHKNSIKQKKQKQKGNNQAISIPQINEQQQPNTISFDRQNSQQQRKTYFINNLSLGPNILNLQNGKKEEKNRISANFNTLADEIQAWKKFVTQQGTIIKSKKKQGSDGYQDSAYKAKKQQVLPQIPDPLKTYRLSLNPEELSAKLRRKFKVSLIKRKKEQQNMAKEDSGIEGWDTLQQQNQSYPNYL